MSKLGEFAKYTKDERNAVYAGLDSHPTGNDRALRLPRTQWLRQHHLKQPIRRLLDFGCHDGFMHRWLLQEWDTELIVGVEICTKAVEHAVRQASEDCMPSGPMAIYLNQGWEDFNQPFLFTDTLASELLEHFPHEENVALLRKQNDYLTVNGRGFITTPHVDRKYGKSNPDPHHINLMDEHQVRSLIDEATGATEVKVDVIGEFVYAVWRKTSG